MKIKYRILFITIAIMLLLSSVFSAMPIYGAEGEGVTFADEMLYQPIKTYDEAPNTFEAWIKLPKSAKTDRAGVILGNYGVSRSIINVEVHKSGNPRLYWTDADGVNANWIFGKVNVCTGEWLHLAIVRSVSEGKVYCYVNGVLKQSLEIASDKGQKDIIPAGGLCLGGDMRSGNAQYFRGAVREAAVFSDVRDAGKIKADMTAVESCAELLAHYDMTTYKAGEGIKDKSGNGCDMRYVSNKLWIESSEMKEPEGYAYSFAVVGDTQKVNLNYPDKYPLIYKWIVENVEKKNIKFVFGLGDITDKSLPEEWDRAKAAMKTLDGVVPYNLVRGNHDKPDVFNKAFPWKDYKDEFGGTYLNTMANTYRTLTVGQVKYLMITLDYGAADKVLDWASKLCEEYADHNVIITTHAYLFRDGTTLDEGDVCPPKTSGGYNNGDHMWDKLIKKHENISLVISGHDPCARIVTTQTEGENGNVVTQMLVDAQSEDLTHEGLGMVAMLYFSEDGKNVRVEYYSTLKEKYFMGANQFDLTLDVLEVELPETTENVTQGGEEAPEVTETETVDVLNDKGCSASIGAAGMSFAVCLMGSALAVSRRKRR